METLLNKSRRVLSFENQNFIARHTKIGCNIPQISCARRCTRRRVCLLIYLQPGVYMCNQVVVGTVVI